MSDQQNLQKQIEDTIKKYQQETYLQMVNQVTPKPPVLRNALAAFGVGGFICAFAQALLNLIMETGMNQNDAGSVLLIIMIFSGALLTGLGVYDNIGRFAGAGSIVPITGFANSIVSSAMEWKREGYVFGVAAKMFSIAGPVLVYGVISSMIIGLIYLFIR